MATIKQLEYRIKQVRGRIERQEEAYSKIRRQLDELTDHKSPQAKRLQDKLMKTERTIRDAQKSMDEYTKEMQTMQDNGSKAQPKTAPTPSNTSSKDPSEVRNLTQKVQSLENRLAAVEKSRRQLELAHQSNLDKFQSIQMQMREFSRVSDRVMITESQIRELLMKIRRQADRFESCKKEKDCIGDDIKTKAQGTIGQKADELEELFKESPLKDKKVFQPQSSSTSPVGEPLVATDVAGHWPWPSGMSRLLKSWLKGRTWWGHGDWLGLLEQMRSAGFEKWCQSDWHAKVGEFLEKNRER